VSTITSRIRAAVGAFGIIAFASPLAAQTHRHGADMRYAAQWVGRSQAGLRVHRAWAMRGWRVERFGWRRGVAVGPARRGPLWRRAWVPRGFGWSYARPFRPAYGRPWRRGWGGRRYGVG
jgi:hypothetical protein